MTSGFAQEEIDAREELELLQRGTRTVRIGDRDERIEADRKQPLDLAAFNGVNDLARGQSLLREVRFGNAPEVCDELSMFRLVDVPSARELIAALAMLASALAIALAGDCAVTATRLADAAAGEDEIDVC